MQAPRTPGLDPRWLLRRMLDAAVAAAQPALCIPAALPQLQLQPQPQQGRLLVIGAGKASAEMALAVERHWQGALEGLVVTRYGYGAPCRRIAIVEAAHPVPDDAGLRAARRMLDLVRGLGPDDTVLCLVSGGGSSLLPLPLPGISLEDKQQLSRALLASGATISEMNCVRRHLSAIKGGRLAAACHPARVVTLLISDVPGDDPRDIASGPTVADQSTCGDALAILRRYRIAVPPHVLDVLESGAGESVKPGDPRLARAEVHLVATPHMALQAAARVALAAGVTPYILGDSLEGEARDVGKVMAGMAIYAARRQGRGEPASPRMSPLMSPFTPPCVLLSGGETTVTVRGQGQGGRNVEFLLSCAIALQGEPGIHGLAADTDGVDGQQEIAGAVIAPDTLARAWAAGLRPAASLDGNDGHGFFQRLGDSVITGPTRTNVNDFRALLVLPPVAPENVS